MIQVSAANSLGIKRFPHFAIFAGIGGDERNSDEVLEFQFWNSKGVLTLQAGAAMTN
jgi:hypothetical protein